MPRATPYTLIDNLSAINSEGVLGPVEVAGAERTIVYIDFGPGTTAGAVQIESASGQGYGGSWVAIGAPVAWAAANKGHQMVIDGGHGALKARISTGIVGGTVKVTANVQK